MKRRMRLDVRVTIPLRDMVRLLSKCAYPILNVPAYFRISIFRVAEKSGVCKL
jgi:hypothetical protein